MFRLLVLDGVLWCDAFTKQNKKGREGSETEMLEGRERNTGEMNREEEEWWKDGQIVWKG